jgi:hypothetical protein
MNTMEFTEVKDPFLVFKVLGKPMANNPKNSKVILACPNIQR